MFPLKTPPSCHCSHSSLVQDEPPGRVEPSSGGQLLLSPEADHRWMGEAILEQNQLVKLRSLNCKAGWSFQREHGSRLLGLVLVTGMTWHQIHPVILNKWLGPPAHTEEQGHGITLKYFFLVVHVSVYLCEVMHMWVYPEEVWGIRSTEAGVTWACQPPTLGPRSWTWVICRSSQLSHPLSCLSSLSRSLNPLPPVRCYKVTLQRGIHRERRPHNTFRRCVP